mgnify:CR=1 FL=1
MTPALAQQRWTINRRARSPGLPTPIVDVILSYMHHAQHSCILGLSLSWCFYLCPACAFCESRCESPCDYITWHGCRTTGAHSPAQISVIDCIIVRRPDSGPTRCQAPTQPRGTIALHDATRQTRTTLPCTVRSVAYTTTWSPNAQQYRYTAELAARLSCSLFNRANMTTITADTTQNTQAITMTKKLSSAAPS